MGTEERATRAARHTCRRPALRQALLSAISFTALLATFSAGLAGWAYAKYDGQITRQDVLQTGDTNIAERSAQRHAANYLIIGSDSRAGTAAKYGRTPGERSDTTILVHLSKDRRHVTVVSFPRDSWVEIPTCAKSGGQSVAQHREMFNSAFSIGGPRCTIATVQKLTGIAVTHFVQVDFAGFRSMVDALGTVSICSPKAVDDRLSRLKLHRGRNQLGGEQALAYVRARETLGDGSDLGRIKRQQRFMGSVLRQALSGTLLRNPVRLTDFLDAATRAIIVDKATSFSDLRGLASAMQGLDPKRVTFYTAPVADRNYSPPGTSLRGKVKLDDKAGRALYGSIIHDQVVRTAPKPGAASSSGSASNAPRPNTNGSEQTCSL